MGRRRGGRKKRNKKRKSGSKKGKKSQADPGSTRAIQNALKARADQKPKYHGVVIISASDIERYGYCPMSWWIQFKGVNVTDERLEEGTDKHKKLISKVSRVREKEDYSKTTEFNIKLFAFIAALLALNAIALVFPISLIKNLLIFIAVLWIIIAMIYFFYNLIIKRYSKDESILESVQTKTPTRDKPDHVGPKNYEQERRSIFHSTPQTWKRTAVWFLIIAGGLALNGIAFLPMGSQMVMTWTFLAIAVSWLFGTMIILYFLLKHEEEQKSKLVNQPSSNEKRSKYKLTESEKLIIGFAVVATLLAINGLTIKQRYTFSQFESIGQIILVLAMLWLGCSFVFLYQSFRSRIVTSKITRDLKQAPSESRRYAIILDTFRSTSTAQRIFSYNWPLLFTVVTIVLGVNSILIRYGSDIMGGQSELFSRFLVIISLLWLFGALVFLYDVLKNTQLTNELRRLHGIYKGQIEYMDKLDKKSKLLFSKKHKIRGKPDYIVNIDGKYIPVEVKTGNIPKGPHFSHILQIAAYCLLITEKYNKRPPYGIISYSKENKHEIVYDSKLENLLLEKLDEMHKCIEQNKTHRNHNRPGKCRNCSRNKECPEKLG